MKKAKTIVAGLMAAAFFLFCAAAYPEPTEQFYANDYAEVLSNETESYIVSQSSSLAERTGAQIVVLTVKTLDGEPAAQYALHAGRQWGIGDKEKNTGVLLLLCPDEGQIYTAVGRGLEGVLNDAKVGRLIDRYALEDYRNKAFDAGTLRLYQALLSEVMKEYGLEDLPEMEQGSSGLSAEDTFDLVMLIVVLVLILVFLVNGNGPHNRYRRWPPFTGGGGFGSGGFGGFGGGGFHSGGGFSGGGFSGGGGSFGGGGAGRRF